MLLPVVSASIGNTWTEDTSCISNSSRLCKSMGVPGQLDCKCHRLKHSSVSAEKVQSFACWYHRGSRVGAPPPRCKLVNQLELRTDLTMKSVLLVFTFHHHAHTMLLSSVMLTIKVELGPRAESSNNTWPQEEQIFCSRAVDVVDALLRLCLHLPVQV